MSVNAKPSYEEVTAAGLAAVQVAQEISDNLATLLALIDAQIRMAEEGRQRGKSATKLVDALIKDLRLIHGRKLTELMERSHVASTVYSEAEIAQSKVRAEEIFVDEIMTRLFGK